jgi:hypothetical protein
VQHVQSDQSVTQWGEQSLTRSDLELLNNIDVVAWAQQVLLLEGFPQVTLEQITVQPALSADPSTAFIGILGAGLITALLQIWWTPYGQPSIPVVARIVGIVTDITPWTWEEELQLAPANSSTYQQLFTIGPSTRDALDAGYVLGY